MIEENLQYAKRKWSKDNLRFLSMERIDYGEDKHFYLVIMYMGERRVAFNCYNPEIKSVLDQTNPQEKAKVWFSANSNEYHHKWYTNLTLKWVEVPRLKEIERSEQMREEKTFTQLIQKK